MNRHSLIAIIILLAAPFAALAQQVVHSAVGDSSAGFADSLRLVNIGKIQQFSAAMASSFDSDILSPKSATFSPDGSKFFINSLEGCRTAVYDASSLKKLGVINYRFDSGKGPLWAEPSNFYPFSHYPDGLSRPFSGKPVESTWSHSGRYLWIPFYRRTFDINAQDPSAIAVVDPESRTIVRMFETGPLPKMVATSPDSRLIAITHWGDNTVGFIDISSPDIARWHHLEPITIGHKLSLNFSLTSPVNRDSNSGYLLRGTVFTPDGRYLLISAMAGPMAVIDIRKHKFVGQVSAVSNVRHLIIDRGYVYGSCNTAGSVIKFSLDSLIAGIKRAGSSSITFGGGIQRCKVAAGARTLEVSPDGRFLFVACNSGNKVCVVDASSLRLIDEIRCDSYPVGLAISPDGRHIVVTSQGRKGSGGNAVNIFELRGLPSLDPQQRTVQPDTTATAPQPQPISPLPDTPRSDNTTRWFCIALALLAIIAIIAAIIHRKRKKTP